MCGQIKDFSICSRFYESDLSQNMMNSKNLKASFNPLIRPYLVAYGAAISPSLWSAFHSPSFGYAASVNGRRAIILTNSNANSRPIHSVFAKAFCFKSKRPSPLENIQDVTFVEGPLLKMFNLSILRFGNRRPKAQPNPRHAPSRSDRYA